MLTALADVHLFCECLDRLRGAAQQFNVVMGYIGVVHVWTTLATRAILLGDWKHERTGLVLNVTSCRAVKRL
jgi:hypothetical protein